MTDDFERLYTLVRHLPRGRVTTYGQLGAMCRITDSRVIGEAMNASRNVPWQRVINARGQISLKGSIGRKQRKLLEAEGIVFDETGSVNLARLVCTPDEAWLTANGYAVPGPLLRQKKTDEDAGADQLSLW